MSQRSSLKKSAHFVRQALNAYSATRRLPPSPHRGKNSTFRDSMSVPQLVFLPRAAIAGNAAIFSPRRTMKASQPKLSQIAAVTAAGSS